MPGAGRVAVMWNPDDNPFIEPLVYSGVHVPPNRVVGPCRQGSAPNALTAALPSEQCQSSSRLFCWPLGNSCSGSP